MSVKFLPLFPLNLVVYPDEKLNLHIYEPRYRQLVNECLAKEITFGITPFISNTIKELGCEVKIVQVNRRYEDGRMDIETMGATIFRLVEFINPAHNRLYAGGDVELVSLPIEAQSKLLENLIEKVKTLYTILQMRIELNFINTCRYVSFELGHKVGLAIEQEYELLTITSETDRQQYLLTHLEKAIPIVADMERTKERIHMNGHFKYFDPLNF
jgi:hypothetical protein